MNELIYISDNGLTVDNNKPNSCEKLFWRTEHSPAKG
jgi:hypothetical protein